MNFIHLNIKLTFECAYIKQWQKYINKYYNKTVIKFIFFHLPFAFSNKPSLSEMTSGMTLYYSLCSSPQQVSVSTWLCRLLSVLGDVVGSKLAFSNLKIYSFGMLTNIHSCMTNRWRHPLVASGCWPIAPCLLRNDYKLFYLSIIAHFTLYVRF